MDQHLVLDIREGRLRDVVQVDGEEALIRRAGDLTGAAQAAGGNRSVAILVFRDGAFAWSATVESPEDVRALLAADQGGSTT